MSFEISDSVSAVFARSGLPEESTIRVAELCKGRVKRIKEEEERSLRLREESAAIQNGARVITTRESNERDDMCVSEQRQWDKLMRLYGEYRGKFQNEKAKHERRQELEEWRAIQIRKLEQEKYRLLHKSS